MSATATKKPARSVRFDKAKIAKAHRELANSERPQLLEAIRKLYAAIRVIEYLDDEDAENCEAGGCRGLKDGELVANLKVIAKELALRHAGYCMA